jgi:hypothetical protein
MATKEEALEDFLKCFRISLNFILLYSKDHKSFLKSISELKYKTDALFAYLNPIEVVFTPDSLSIEGVFYSKMNLHKELAALFHQRKIQSLRLSPGITDSELVILLDKLSLAPKEIIRSGGLAAVFSGIPGAAHFSVTDLDYSQLLRGDGEEVKDIWSFMLHNAVARGDSEKIDEFADNFEVMISKFKAENIADNEELKNDLQKFLEYLKVKEPEKFLRCRREIPKLILKDKTFLLDPDKARKLKNFISGLSPEDYAQILWNDIAKDEKLDTTSLTLFSRLLGDDENKKIAVSLAGNLSGKGGAKIPANVAQKVRELFSSSSGSSPVPEIYRQAILSMGESQNFHGVFVFDRKQMMDNYRYTLLNLLVAEKNREQSELIADSLSKEWEAIAGEKDLAYLKCLEEVIRLKSGEDPKLPGIEELAGKFYCFIEAFIWDEAPLPGIAAIFENMRKSYHLAPDYLSRIFDEGKVNAGVIRAFLRFFPDELPDFYSRLKDKSQDIDFVARVLEALRQIDSPLVLDALENIYSFSGDIIKIEIIQIMSQIGRYNRGFLFDVLKTGTAFLKKEALSAITEQQDTQKAMEILFLVPNPWGRNNQVLKENLGIVEEARYKQARQYLEYLGRNTAFWNIGLKKRVKQVLEGLNV